MLSIVLDILQKKCEANVIMIINDTLYLLYTFILSSNIYLTAYWDGYWIFDMIVNVLNLIFH